MINFVKRSYNIFLCKDRKLARSIRKITGITPTNVRIYKLAFLHKSLSTTDSKLRGNNERLEYLGDSILSTVVADYLYHKYPNHNEGFLTKMRSKLVKRKTLNNIAEEMGLDIILADYTTGNISSAMQGNALEALLGAYYIENGYRASKQYIVEEILRKYVNIHLLEESDDNYKSKLLEHCQKNNLTADFQVIKQYKFNKRDRFKMAAVIDGTQFGIAEDYNKKAAEQKAAYHAIAKMGFDSKIKKLPASRLAMF